MIDTTKIHRDLRALQEHIVTALEQVDGRVFFHDAWQRPANQSLCGQGVSCVLEKGHIFERAGVNFSHVHGDTLPAAATAIPSRKQLAGHRFEALGLSLIIHPENPFCPTVHMNVRLLIVHAPTVTFWFGGGMDLSPYYGFTEDARHFHRACRDALMPFGADLYPQFKKACDAYFFLPHRNEPRGIGGIFYDDFSALGLSRGIEMMYAVAKAFLPAYLPIVTARCNIPFGERERTFQAYRRGRYVEFNLTCDRGTLFGLQSGGRTESILMSMPPVAQWRYDYRPEPGSAEAQLYSDFLVVREWI